MIIWGLDVYPYGSIYCPFKDSGPKKLYLVWCLEAESLNGRSMDPLGILMVPGGILVELLGQGSLLWHGQGIHLSVFCCVVLGLGIDRGPSFPLRTSVKGDIHIGRCRYT